MPCILRMQRWVPEGLRTHYAGLAYLDGKAHAEDAMQSKQTTVVLRMHLLWPQVV
jgi:hypothetical protein